MNEYLNPSAILQDIENGLGFGFNELELDPNQILATIRRKSLPVFSKYYPFIVYWLLDTASNNYKVPGNDNRYYIKIKNMDNAVLGVSEVFLSNNYFGDIAGLGYTSAISTNGSEAQLIADILSNSRVPITFKNFYEDNSFAIYPGGYTNTNLLVKVKVVHNKDFSSIPLNMREYFLELALYDVQESLLPLRRRFANIRSALGDIELFIQDLDEAKDKRKELIETFRRDFLKSPNRKKIYIY